MPLGHSRSPVAPSADFGSLALIETHHATQGKSADSPGPAEYQGCLESRDHRRACFDDLSSPAKSAIITPSCHMRDQAADLYSQSAIGATHAPFSRPQFMAGVMSALRSTELWLGLQLHDTCHPLPSRWPYPEGTAMPELTVERVRELFSYDPLTGVLTWNKQPRGRYKQSLTAGAKNTNGHLRTNIDGKAYYNHRIIWFMVYECWPSNEIDHINGNPEDNRLENLRDVSHRTNQENICKPSINNSTGFLGVYWSARDRVFRSQIMTNRRWVCLGSFKDPEDAHQAYLTAKRKLHEGNMI